MTSPKTPLTFTCRPLDDDKMYNILCTLHENDWSSLESLPINDAFELFNKTLLMVLDKFAPEKHVTIPYKNIIRDPWITPALLVSSNKRLRLYKKCINKDKSDESHYKYVTYRNLFNKLKRQSKFQYYSELLDKYKDDICKTWKVINSINGSKNDKSSISDTFIVDGISETNSVKIANGFCRYYSEIGKTLADNIPPPPKHFDHYMSNNNPNSIYFNPTDQNEILNILDKMKAKKSCGHDKLNAHFLKQIKFEISAPLAILMNRSMNEGIVPDTLKLAKVIPIYKSKDKQQFNNYRPISLLPCVSKILEKVIHKRVYNFLAVHDVFYNKQYGFRPKHSTINAVQELIYDTLNSFEGNTCTVSAFLDLSKAFDTIDHAILLKKLNHYGIRGVALDWFRSYLTNRRQYTCFKNACSDTMLIGCGVPQGSVLGPLLFIIYSNDCPKSLNICTCILFADDTTVFYSHQHLPTLLKLVENDLENLLNWFKSNKLSLNVTKTNLIIFSKNDLPNYDELSITVDAVLLKPVKSVKFLGINLDHKLDWHAHARYVTNKLSSGIYVLNSAKHLLLAQHLKMLYYTLLHPYLTYGIILWGSAWSSLLNPIAMKQNKAVRCISKAKYNATALPLYKNLKIPTLKDIYNIELGKFMYLHNNKQLPPSLMRCFTLNESVHTHNTRHIHDPHILTRKSNIMSRSFLCKGPEMWLNLPTLIKSSGSRNSFKSQIKGYFLSKY
jgi:hypothetical protein